MWIVQFTSKSYILSLSPSLSPLQREKELMDTRERYTELEEKLGNMGSTLEAYGHSSESEVIHRLQSEVRSLCAAALWDGWWGKSLL